METPAETTPSEVTSTDSSDTSTVTSTVQDIDTVTKKLVITVPAETVTQQFQSSITRLTKTVRIKGFREGKAPRQLVEKMYGERVRAEVHGDLVQSGLRDAAKQHDLSIVGNPQVNVSSIEVGKPFEFTADVSVYPRPEVHGFDSFEVSVPKREVTDKEVDAVVEYLRKNRATVKPLEGRTVLQKGDVGHAEFVVIEDGGEPSTPEPYSFCLGDGQIPKEVEIAFEGMSIGESREATVKGPGQDTDKPGKDITYRGTLKTISERVLPELDDAFAKLVEPAATTVPELKQKIRESLTKEKETEHRSDVNAAIIKKLTDSNQFAVPDVLVDDEIRGILISRGFVDPKKMNLDNLPMDIFRKDLGEAALRRVRAAIIIDQIVEKESIKLSKEDVETATAETAQNMNITVQQAQRELFQKDRAVQFMVETLRTKCLETLRGRAKITFTEPTSEVTPGQIA